MNSIFAELSELISNLLFTALSHGFLFAFIGLTGSILLISWLNRRKAFNRIHPVWTFFAKINLVYIPVLLTLLLGANGLVVGLQKTCNDWIDTGTQPVVAYANTFLPTLQATAMSLDLNSALTLEEMIVLEMGKDKHRYDGAYAEDFIFHYNTAIAGALLEEMGYPREIDEMVQVLRTLDLTQIDNDFFNRIPVALKTYAGNYFFILYQMILVGFLPFLLIPVGEYGIHFFVNRFLL